MPSQPLRKEPAWSSLVAPLLNCCIFSATKNAAFKQRLRLFPLLASRSSHCLIVRRFAHVGFPAFRDDTSFLRQQKQPRRQQSCGIQVANGWQQQIEHCTNEQTFLHPVSFSKAVGYRVADGWQQGIKHFTDEKNSLNPV